MLVLDDLLALMGAANKAWALKVDLVIDLENEPAIQTPPINTTFSKKDVLTLGVLPVTMPQVAVIPDNKTHLRPLAPTT